jgi:hypothetical protein
VAIKRRKPALVRGQGLVELSLVMPILILLLVMAVDFGRVYFGWIALQNAARIGASQAAAEADDWESGDATVRSEYQQAVANDLRALNCNFGAVPDPVFSGYDDGDHVRVDLACGFDLITPLASNIVGRSIELDASAEFAVHSVIVGGIPAPPPPPPPGDCTVPNFTDGDRKNQADGIWSAAGFTSSVTKIGGSGNWAIVDQSLSAGSIEPCDTPITVFEEEDDD